MTAASPSLLTPVEVADRLRVAQKTLAQWRWRGVGPAYVKVGGLVRYTPEALAAWIADRGTR